MTDTYADQWKACADLMRAKAVEKSLRLRRCDGGESGG